MVLVSGTGTNLQALLDAAADPAYGATVVAVGADRDGIEGLARAERAGLPTFVHRVKDFTDRADWDRALTASVAEHRPDLVISAGFMKLVGTAFLTEFGGRFVNTHPALSPAFPGMHGAAEALAYGVKVTGCTIFFVDDGVDTGPIVAQAAVRVEDDDTVGFAARADQGRRAGAAGRHRRRDGAPGLHHRGQEGPPWLTHDARIPITRALVSVYDKSGLEELVRGLHEAGVALVSTGGSAALIEGLGIPVTKVEELTGFPECLDGRVKTLHPKVHAGILADRRLDSHVQQLDELGIEPFDLVVSNLYPFRQTVLSGASPDECVEQIDIGGPSMVRAAAKNHPSVAIVTSPARYADVLAAVAAGGFTLAERQRLAAEAFQHTATYDVAVASWMSNVLTDTSEGTGFPSWTGATWDKAAVLRYGENPHQPAALYRATGAAASPPPSSCTARRCPTTTTSTPTRPGGRRTTSPSRRWRSSSTRTRAASRSAPTWPRRTARRTSATRRRRSAA